VENTWYFAGGSWLILVFINTALAAALGRSRIGYFLFSLLFAPVVTVVLALIGRNEAYFVRR